MPIDYSQPIAAARELAERTGDLFPAHRAAMADALARYALEAGPEHPQQADLLAWADRLSDG